jgi:hypothetical protein
MLLLYETDINLQLQIAVIQVAHFDIPSVNTSLLGSLAYEFLDSSICLRTNTITWHVWYFQVFKVAYV